jgi:hypothetical protein
LAASKLAWPPVVLLQSDVKDLSDPPGSEFGGDWNRRHGLPPYTKPVEQNTAAASIAPIGLTPPLPQPR